MLLKILKFSCKSFIKNAHIVIFAYLIMPIALTLGLGFMMSGATIKPNIEPVNVQIIDNDSLEYSKAVFELFKHDEIKDIYVLSDEEAEYTVEIPKGYENALLGKGDVNLKIIAKDDASTTKGVVLKQILESATREFSKNSIILEKSGENKAIFEEYSALRKSMERSLFSNEIVEAKKVLNTYENYSIEFIFMLGLMYAISAVQSTKLFNENGMNKRMKAMPITEIRNFNYNFLTSAFEVFVLLVLYVVFFKISGISFQVNILVLLPFLVLLALFFTSIGSLFSSFGDGKIGYALITVLFMIHMGISSMSGVTYESNLAWMRFIKEYSFSRVSTLPLKEYFLTGGFSSSKSLVIALIALTFSIYSINLMIVRKKRGVL